MGTKGSKVAAEFTEWLGGFPGPSHWRLAAPRIKDVEGEQAAEPLGTSTAPL